MKLVCYTIFVLREWFCWWHNLAHILNASSKIIRYCESTTTAKAVKTSPLILYIYRELVCWFQPIWLCGLDRFSKDIPLFHHNVWMMMKMSFPSTPIRRAHSAVYQEVILNFWHPLGSIPCTLGGRPILTETCLFDDITARRWTIDKFMDDYYTSTCI